MAFNKGGRRATRQSQSWSIGNWAADLESGSKYGYSLLFIILLSNFVAVCLQNLCIKLGIASGMDLAQACKYQYGKRTVWGLYALAEIAIVATDVAEVVGTAIALSLLSGGRIKLWMGVWPDDERRLRMECILS